MKKILMVLSLLFLPFPTYAGCVSGNTYTLKGYVEDGTNAPVAGNLNQVFDIFYDDGTSSIGNAFTAEMGQGWYRWNYTSNGKKGVWVMRDSTAIYKNFPGGFLEILCDSQDASQSEVINRVRRIH